MIYLTGDLHGDRNRFKSKEMRKLHKGDTLIVCGDFGFVWDGSAAEKRLLGWIGRRKYQVLFVEGSHDNLNLLEQYPVARWHGGRVRELSGRLRQLLRGEVYEIEGKRIFTFGGGVDDNPDAARADWWDKQLPTAEEIEAARGKLERCGYAVDYIVTHQPCRKIRQFLAMDHNDANALDTFLDEVRETCRYRQWFFGSVHVNKRIPPGETALFQRVVPADPDTP